MAPKRVTKPETPMMDIKDFPTPSVDNRDLRMSYRIARGEQGVSWTNSLEHYKTLPSGSRGYGGKLECSVARAAGGLEKHLLQIT